ncbi:MAG: lipid-A-disaccharide synthase [Chitinophagaceae bacterium]
MKYYIIAGEASGDLHGSNLIKELKKLDNNADIRCWGGDMMESAGATLVKHYRDLAFMGFIEVVKNLPTIFQNMKFCKKDILRFKPDVVIFIDYPGFNIPIARFAKNNGFKTVYYISPQVWAWKEGRVKTLKKVIDKMLVILPFEKDFYKKWNYDVEYVGHPLVEVIEENRKLTTGQPSTVNRQPAVPGQPSTVNRQPTIALLPGSRKQEISKKLPIMLEVCKFFPDCRFVVAQAPSLSDEFILQFTNQYSNVEIVKGKTYSLLMESDAALVTSGTATLETALFGIPEVVCYKGSAVSFEIAKRLIKVKYISLVNLIMDKQVVTELIQDQLTPDNLKKELESLLYDPKRRERLANDYRELWEILSKGGHASAKAATSIVHIFRNS